MTGSVRSPAASRMALPCAAVLAGGLLASASQAFTLGSGAPLAAPRALAVVGVAEQSAGKWGAGMVAIALGGGLAAAASAVRGRPSGPTARGPVNKLRADLAAAKEKEALITFRMTSAEKAERQLGTRLQQLDQEKEQVQARLQEQQERLARLEAETAARIEEVKRQAEEETRKAVEAARRQAGSATGEADVRKVMEQIESKKAAEAREWQPHVFCNFSGGIARW